jgi:hypothetical protein
MKLQLWQFRLRSLFVLLLISALAAAWWSHRHHCLERAEFHERQAKSDIEEAATAEAEAFLAKFLYSSKLVEEQYELAMEQAEKAQQEFHEALNVARASARIDLQQRSAEHDFFDKTTPERTRIDRAISAGYLLAHVADAPPLRSNPSVPTPQQPEPTVTVEEIPYLPPPAATPPPPANTPPASPEQMAFERRANALHVRSKFHEQQKKFYLRAIYRPWMDLQEPLTPEVPAEPKP